MIALETGQTVETRQVARMYASLVVDWLCARNVEKSRQGPEDKKSTSPDLLDRLS